jgi:glycosyltransferase involved in cell wall biosynthesis
LMQPPTLVSVVMPMRNAERYVADSLRSLLAQAGQGEAFELEVIVVDDGSADRSATVVRGVNDARVRIVPGPQRGISAAFNAGLAAARGDILARCDADDLYPPDRLAWQVRWLNDHADFGAVCGHYTLIDDAGRAVHDMYGEYPPGDVTEELKAGRSRSHMCAYAFRTDVLRALGGCREWFVTSEDADLQFRLAETTRVWFAPRLSYLYRLHESSITHQQASPRRQFYEAMAKRFQQQRLTGGQDDLQRGEPPAVPTTFDTDQAPPRPAREQIQQMLISRSWKEHAAGRKGQAIATGMRACLQRPLNAGAWKSVIALLVKRSEGTAG